MSGHVNGTGPGAGTEYEPDMGPESEDSLQAQLDAAQRRIAELERVVAVETLTNLSRRRVVELLMQAHVERERPFGVVMLDLDGLKKVNDHQGHAMGDELLRRAADAIRANIRELDGDIAARWGGDEMVVLVRHGDDIDAVAARLQYCVFQAVHNQGAGVSVGAARFPHDGADADTVVAVADARMYVNKRERKAGR